MSSEELDKSLHSEIESYLGGRLSDVKAEVARLHSQLNEAFSSLLERAFEDQAAPSESAIAATIAEHLRASHERGVEWAAAESAKAQAANEVALLKAAIEDIDNQRSQAEILGTLVNRAASFAPRIAFFVVRNETAQGWRARGLEGTVGDDAVRQATLLFSDEHAVSEAYRSQSAWSGAPGANAQDHILCNHFGSEPPQHIAALPLAIRNKVVAVLYADSGALDSGAVKLEALEALVRVTGMAVELLAVTRGAPRLTPVAPVPEPVAEPAAPAAEETSQAPETVAAAVAVTTVAAVALTETAAEEETATEPVAEETTTPEAEAVAETEAEAAPAYIAEVEAEVETAPEAEAVAVAGEEFAPAVAIAEAATAAEYVPAEPVAETAEIVAAATPESYSVSEPEEIVAEAEVAVSEEYVATAEVAAESEEEVSFGGAEAAPEMAGAPAPEFGEYETAPSSPFIPEYQPTAFTLVDEEEETVTSSFEVPTVEAKVPDVMAEVAAPVAEIPSYMPPMPAPANEADFTAPPPPAFVEVAENIAVPEPQSYAAPVTETPADDSSWAMVESATQEAVAESAPEPQVAPKSLSAVEMPETVAFTSSDLIPPAPPAPEQYIPAAPPAPEPFAAVKAEAVATPPNFAPVTTQYTAPLGSARTFGRDIDLPINVNDDERRLHTDARRFARLLVSEIKLYNEPKVQEGRELGNIYNLLREAIDRSRQMYDRRVAPPVASQFDYFHYELVNTLAEGDAGKLGQEYPGAAI